MTTVTGSVLDAMDRPLHIVLTFSPLSSPFILNAGEVIAKNVVQIKTAVSDGTFSVQLESGSYTVTFGANPNFQFNITVPSAGGPYTIGQLTNLPAPSPIYTPSGSGSPEGVVMAPPGSSYVDVVNDALYFKLSGTSNTGWQEFVQL